MAPPLWNALRILITFVATLRNLVNDLNVKRKDKLPGPILRVLVMSPTPSYLDELLQDCALDLLQGDLAKRVYYMSIYHNYVRTGEVLMEKHKTRSRVEAILH